MRQVSEVNHSVLILGGKLLCFNSKSVKTTGKSSTLCHHLLFLLIMAQDQSVSSSVLGNSLYWLSKMPLGFLQGLARLAAGVIARIQSASAVKTIERNLLIAFPHLSPSERQQLAKQALQAQFQSMLEFVKCWGNAPQFSLNQIKQVEGECLLTQAIEEKKGLILVVPHFGSWEIMNAWLNQFAAMVIMYKPSKNPQLDQFVLQARSRLRATLVPTDENGVRQIFKALKQGGVTAILPDHIPEQSGGIYAPFFDCPVLTTTLVSRLAQKTQCAVLQLSCLRNTDHNGFHIKIEAIDDAIRSKDLQVSVNALNASIERLIARHPAHYHWTYKRFKANPLLEDIYNLNDAQAITRIKAAQADFLAKNS